MMAGKVVELLKKSRATRVALVGGGVSRNRVLLSILRETCPELFVPPEAVGFEAMGALLWAERRGVPVTGDRGALTGGGRSFSSLPPLPRGMAQVTFHDLPAGSCDDSLLSMNHHARRPS